ncbi:hypothetical protein K523DRAFT_357120 [Schizophyllum commune Tattone D]|nr:hypothetical protein K523DRAFT_357120 [Schizophyllum commune Tattone D]
MNTSTDSLESSFQLVVLDGGLDSVEMDVSDSIPGDAAHAGADPAPSGAPVTAPEANLDVSVSAPPAPASVAAPVAASTAPAAAAPNAADLTPAAPASAQDGSAARNRFICYDPAEHRAGVALGFVPEVNLVVGDRIPLDASKYYAVVRGRFVGVFATSYAHGMAISKVSGPISWCPETLSAALDYFNEMREMGVCEVVN